MHVFVLDECKYIYQEGCSSSFRDVVRLFYFIRFARGWWLRRVYPRMKIQRRPGVFQRKNGEGGGSGVGGEKGVGGLKKLALNENVIPLRGEFVYN